MKALFILTAETVLRCASLAELGDRVARLEGEACALRAQLAAAERECDAASGAAACAFAEAAGADRLNGLLEVCLCLMHNPPCVPWVIMLYHKLPPCPCYKSSSLPPSILPASLSCRRLCALLLMPGRKLTPAGRLCGWLLVGRMPAREQLSAPAHFLLCIAALHRHLCFLYTSA